MNGYEQLENICNELDYTFSNNKELDIGSIIQSYRVEEEQIPVYEEFINKYYNTVIRNSDKSNYLLDAVDCSYVTPGRVIHKMLNMGSPILLLSTLTGMAIDSYLATPVCVLTGFGFGLHQTYATAKQKVKYGEYTAREMSSIASNALDNEIRERHRLKKDALIRQTMTKLEEVSTIINLG